MNYGVIGKNISYSYSKIIHQVLGMYEYDIINATEKEFIDIINSRNFKGLNVTIPYKQIAHDFCDMLTPAARKIGAVNTLYFQDGKLIGDNTDIYGFIANLNLNEIDYKNKNITILGTGATATMIYKSLNEYAKKINFVSSSGNSPFNYDNISKLADTQLLINATPVGTYPDVDKTLIPNPTIFKHLENVVDVIYNPSQTELLLTARDMGINTVNGLGMLVYQALASAVKFSAMDSTSSLIDKYNELHSTDNSSPITSIQMLADKIMSIIKNENENIVLIGMPGCGKSTLGQKIAAQKNMQFYDTDALIEKNTGISCSDFILKYGENKFRKEELKVCRELKTSSKSVIATGGGLITQNEAINLLRHNATVVWIKRKIKDFDLKDRPLTPDKTTFMQVYEQRKKLYEKYADTVYYNDYTPTH